LDENYDDLSQAQQKMIEPFMITSDSDLHFYERLYYIPLSSTSLTQEHLHDVATDIIVDGTYSALSSFEPSPIDMKLNKNEEERIE
jgi:hypothetical protein